jgi:hypothetical protein
MAGTGFFDSFEPVDTTKDPKGNTKPAHPVKGEVPSASLTPEELASDTPPHPEIIEDYHTEEPPKDSNTEPSVSQSPMKVQSSNPAMQIINSARGRSKRVNQNFVFCGINGPPKSGKTGIVLDSLSKAEEEDGAEIWHLDFDLGGETTKAAHHGGKENIVVLNPWVLNHNPSRVPYDFPATYQRTLDFLLAAAEVADAQMAHFNEHGTMPKPYLKTVVFDGADHWLNICETVMKVDDLKLGPDGISVAGRDATTKIGRFNWNIRKNRYNSALTALLELCRRGLHCYLITHPKPAYDGAGNEIIGASNPHWLKDTEGWLQQMIEVEVEEERDERGELTGVVNSYAVMTQNRTSLKSPGRVHLFRKDTDGGEWFGWPGMRDGSFIEPAKPEE